MTEDQIKHMVDRFLGWELPRNFSPDGGVRYTPHWPAKMPMPSGTNLFDATQADAMVRYMVEGLPDDGGLQERLDQALAIIEDLRKPPRRDLTRRGAA